MKNWQQKFVDYLMVKWFINIQSSFLVYLFYDLQVNKSLPLPLGVSGKYKHHTAINTETSTKILQNIEGEKKKNINRSHLSQEPL